MRLNETRHSLKIKSKMNDANFMEHFSNRRCFSHDEPLTKWVEQSKDSGEGR